MAKMIIIILMVNAFCLEEAITVPSVHGSDVPVDDSGAMEASMTVSKIKRDTRQIW